MYTLKNYFSKYLNMSSEAETTVPVETTAEKGDEPQEVAAGPSTSSMESKTENSEKKEKLLDLAFAMDCTGSMSSQIQQAKDNIRQIVEEIVSKESADVHLALVEYRDHPPQDSTFITRPHDFTSSVRTMKGWLEQCSAEGGGDVPEAIADALYDLDGLSWRPGSTRIAVLITDAPPHGIGHGGDELPQGCPRGIDPLEMSRALASHGVILYTVGCGRLWPLTKHLLMTLAHITGGQYVPLANAASLPAVIIGGAREEISLQSLTEEVEREVQKEVGADHGNIDLEKLTDRVHAKLQGKGRKTSHVHQRTSAGHSQPLPRTSAEARRLSNLATLTQWREECPQIGLARDTEASKGTSNTTGTGPARRVAVVALPDHEEPDGDMSAAQTDVQAEENTSPAVSFVSVEGEVSYEQTYRIVTRALAQQNLQH